MTNAAIVTEVRRRYGRTQALDGATFEIGSGVTGLLGPNGAGKTTLLRILATVAAPDSGQITVFGRDPANGAERTEIRRRLGYLPQDPGFQRGFSVFEFVDYVAILKELSNRQERHDEVRRVIESVDLTSVSGAKKRLSSVFSW